VKAGFSHALSHRPVEKVQKNDYIPAFTIMLMEEKMKGKSFWESVNLEPDILQIVRKMVKENPFTVFVFKQAESYEEAKSRLQRWLADYFQTNTAANNYLQQANPENFNQLSWRDYAAIRLHDYLENEGKEFKDPNLGGRTIRNEPIKTLWLAIRFGKGNNHKAFFLDTLYLFRQLNGKLARNLPDHEKLNRWMARHPNGLDKKVIAGRQKNKDKIIRQIIQNIDTGQQKSRRFQFKTGSTFDEKYQQVSAWWNDYRFHLSFAVRHPDMLNQMLGNSLSKKTMKRLYDARKKGIPLFVNPHYLSLLCEPCDPDTPVSDRALRDYIFPSQKLIDAFGSIVAWEKEDVMRPGEPNAAGWILPSWHNIHRRYPDVAIFIPDTTGRACAGLCASCQRMYDFQNGHFNFNLKKLKPKLKWPEKMRLLMNYFENDTQLRDILITGGDAFMNSDAALEEILQAVYDMALRKKEANKGRREGEKYAEFVRIRLGTRIPVYLPQRITDSLIAVLAHFRQKASAIGIRQFIIQTHIESAMEITPETRDAVQKLLRAGWLVTNQQVFITAASLRGHTAKLRKVLNDIGILPYYTFSVKGFMENQYNFSTNARSVQEMKEEKLHGKLPAQFQSAVSDLHQHPAKIFEVVEAIRKQAGIPFLATDRNVMNLPGVGKSMGFRTIGITKDGRRILRFKHDVYRRQSPIIKKMGDVIIIESKSLARYLKQLESMGQYIREYQSIWGYSVNESEAHSLVYLYPDYSFTTTKELTHFSPELIPKKE
jgi:lysine 2,3-aminomutase